MNYIISGQNVKLAVEDINPRGRQALFFIHGWPLNRKIFEYQTNVFPKLGYRCVLMDLRGFGESDRPWEGYTYDRMAQDVYTVITRMNLRNIILIGFSMGGAIAIRYMANYGSSHIKKLALLAAAAPSFTKRPGYPYGMSPQDVDKLIRQAYTDRPKMNSDFGKMLFASNPSSSLQAYFQDISNSSGGYSTIKTALSLRDEDLSQELPKIHVPTGIFHGKLDRVCPFPFAIEMEKSIPNSTLYPFENSGHAVFYDELDLFNERFHHFAQE